MGLLKVGQLGVLAAALTAPFVGSGCTKKIDKPQAVRVETVEELPQHVFMVEVNDPVSEEKFKEELQPLEITELKTFADNKNWYEVTIASKLSPSDIQLQIQRLPEVKSTEHGTAYDKDGKHYIEFTAGNKKTLDTSVIEIKEFKIK